MEDKLQKRVTQYLSETLGILPVFGKWGEAGRVPPILRADYGLSAIRFLGREWIAVSLKDVEGFSPAKLAKHLAWIDHHCQQRGIFVAERLEAYNRRRLIERKIPFIIPGNQLYLPDLGIDFREHLRKVGEKRATLSPSAQVAVLAFLLGKTPPEPWTATSLAKVLGFTKMTSSRVSDELEGQELIEVRTGGREKLIHFKGRGRELWERARSVMRSPVQRRVYVETAELPYGEIAGLSALSELTMIAAPGRSTKALTSREWKSLQVDADLRIVPPPSADLAPFELEIWRYDPRLLSQSGVVDPLSLFLSLEGTNDERVEGALDELLEGVKW